MATAQAEPAHGIDTTEKARAALARYFRAIASHDSKTQRALTWQGRYDDWHAKRFVVDDTITPVTATGRGPLGASPSDVRVFHAQVRLWPGDGSIEPGEPLGWFWILARDSKGAWRVYDWGV